ncbi:Major Facilitator Superfamily protein [Burkholderia sp. 8Y]|uniref:MFS transporter n=1 Tax=Burkholderia sp. 8Y TaxID=2653133 RepID=UPI0012F0EF74|nr:MFS transporter [Burkholderia sp. 8Y]VXC45520.1 Major Facilitator Superfamily protein [Burkholderia sp. 8Y]
MNLFLLATFIYRFANGLLFLAVAWNLVRSANGGAMPLAISAIGGFLPAVIAAPFARRLLERVDTGGLTLWGMVGLCACALAFTPFLHHPGMLLAINFMVLSVFFILEGAWDALLATIASGLTPSESDRLNARQSAATQAGLMLGGLPLGLLVRLGGGTTPFFAAAMLYVVALSLFASPALQRVVWGETRRRGTGAKVAAKMDAAASTSRTAWTVIATLALVWPCLTLVNMVVPLVANSKGHGTVEHAAVLDAAIGLGMACIGVAYEWVAQWPTRMRRGLMTAAVCCVPLPFVVLLAFPYWLPVLALAFFLCGIGFGLLRVSLREQLIAIHPAHRVGQIVASCNAYGFPMLAIFALLYALSWERGAIVPLGAFFAMAVIGGIATLGSRRASAVQRKSTAADIG